jgi:diguanylate cyclase (GGDEF)-like protein
VRHALCYLDLDQFKVVNDSCGHAAGDELLRQITVLLQSRVRARDTLARLGGDEFGLLLDNCPLTQAFEIAKTLVAAVREFRFASEGRIFQLGVSIGLVPVTTEAESTAQLLTRADVA